jgi:hypothetical protein
MWLAESSDEKCTSNQVVLRTDAEKDLSATLCFGDDGR